MGVDASFIIAAEVAAATAAVLTIDESMDMARVSKRYADIYKEKDDHYFTIFRNNSELVFINEIWSLPIPAYDFVGQRNRIPFNPFIGAMPGGAGISSPISAYLYSELTILQGAIFADIGNYLFAFEKERVRIEDDRRFEYRLNVVNTGLGLANDVRERLSNSLAMLEDATNNKADNYASLSNEIFQISGFRDRLAQEPIPPSIRFDAPVVGRSPASVLDIQFERNQIGVVSRLSDIDS
jgi:hypothetical protein